MDEHTYEALAEQSVLGSILVDPRCLPEVERSLKPEDFRLEADCALYRAALALEREGSALDPLLILDRARKLGSQVSARYAMELMEITPTAANVGEYIRLVREDRLRDGLLETAETIRAGVASREDPAALLSAAGQRLDALAAQGSTGKLVSPNDGIMAYYRQRESVEEGDAKGYVCTGYMALDELLGGGMLNSGLYLLAARPGMGKTTLALNIADRVAQVDPVLFVSLEMDTEQLSAKRLSRETGVPSQKLLMQALTQDEEDRVAAAARKLAGLAFWSNDTPTVTVDDIGVLARSIGGLRLIVVDYFGKILPPPEARRAGRYEYTTEISGALKNLARTLHLPILVLCQLNREVEARQDKRPKLSDLRDTGALEQDADGVIFLYREDYYAERDSVDPTVPSLLEVDLAKNRHGAVGGCKLAFSMASSKIAGMSYRRKIKEEIPEQFTIQTTGQDEEDPFKEGH